MSKFGACMDGFHADYPNEKRACKGQSQRWFVPPYRRGKPQPIEFLDEYTDCDCPCHGGEVKKTTRKRKK